jgi:hypothetical protein
MIGTHPPFRRRPGALYIDVALTALAFSLPMAAGAQTSVKINSVNGGADISTFLPGSISGVFTIHNDPLTAGGAGTYALVPLDSSKPVPILPSGNRVEITDWSGTGYSVAGGGVMGTVGNVTNNQVILNGTTAISGKVIGGIAGSYNTSLGVNADGGSVQGNKVIMNGGTVTLGKRRITFLTSE